MLKKVCDILSNIIFVVLIILVLLLFVPNFIGYKSMAVISGSMEPNIPVGSIVYVKDAGFDDFKVGDIMSYQISGSTMVTHRVESIDKKSRSIVTKGDANDTVDSSPVKESQIVGKVAFSIPVIGFISIYMKTPLGIAIICGIVFILILLNLIPDLVKKEKE